MIKTKKLALYGHGLCGSDFYTEIDEDRSMKYSGTCPSCNKRVVLAPKELFPTTDKARRSYISKAKSGQNFIFWQV
jgi:DNA-directed RNA polymerase subunit RPC12/RpoP